MNSPTGLTIPLCDADVDKISKKNPKTKIPNGISCGKC